MSGGIEEEGVSLLSGGIEEEGVSMLSGSVEEEGVSLLSGGIEEEGDVSWSSLLSARLHVSTAPTTIRGWRLFSRLRR